MSRRHRYYNAEVEVPDEAEEKPKAAPKRKSFAGIFAGAGIKDNIDSLTTAGFGTVGFFANNALHGAIQSSFLSQYGLLVTEAVSVGIIVAASGYFLNNQKQKKAILIGALINVGISLIKNYLPQTSGMLSGNKGMGQYIDSDITYRDQEVMYNDTNTFTSPTYDGSAPTTN